MVCPIQRFADAEHPGGALGIHPLPWAASGWVRPVVPSDTWMTCVGARRDAVLDGVRLKLYPRRCCVEGTVLVGQRWANGVNARGESGERARDPRSRR